MTGIAGIYRCDWQHHKHVVVLNCYRTPRRRRQRRRAQIAFDEWGQFVPRAPHIDRIFGDQIHLDSSGTNMLPRAMAPAYGRNDEEMIVSEPNALDPFLRSLHNRSSRRCDARAHTSRCRATIVRLRAWIDKREERMSGQARESACLDAASVGRLFRIRARYRIRHVFPQLPAEAGDMFPRSAIRRRPPLPEERSTTIR